MFKNGNISLREEMFRNKSIRSVRYLESLRIGLIPERKFIHVWNTVQVAQV